jgi:CBS domain containing-hemolysin-like protein
MGCLLVGVAFFSAAETALFNLTRHQLDEFARRSNPAHRLAARLMRRPDGTLITLLLATQIGNVLFFAIASVLVISTSEQLAGWQSTVLGFVPVLAAIFLGGVLPKVTAATYPSAVAGIVAGPIYAIDRIIWPIREVLLHVVVTPGVRLLSPVKSSMRPVGHEELQELLEHSASTGLLATDESLLLQEVVELGTIKVREIAIPRVDVVRFNVAESREAFLDLVRRTGMRRVLAFRDGPDDPIGLLDARTVVLDPEPSLEHLLEPLWYVPETKTIDSLLRDFQQSGRETAVAVDEYGGITGLVTLHHIIEQIVGDIFEPGEPDAEPVRKVAEDTYLISGRLSVREWAEAFGQRFSDLGVNTIGGLITAQLGRIPKPGDTGMWRNLQFTVTRVHRNRVIEARLDRLARIPSRREGRT